MCGDMSNDYLYWIAWLRHYECLSSSPAERLLDQPGIEYTRFPAARCAAQMENRLLVLDEFGVGTRMDESLARF